MILRLDPDRLGDIKADLGHLINRHGITETRFGYYDAADGGPRCGRCNNLLHNHLWQLVDPNPADEDLAAQAGVLDCETT